MSESYCEKTLKISTLSFEMLFFRTTSNEIIVSNLVCVIERNNKNKNCEQFFDNLLQSQVQMFCLSGKSTKPQQL